MRKPKKMVYTYKGVDIIWSVLCGGTWIVLLDQRPRFCTISEAKEYVRLNKQ